MLFYTHMKKVSLNIVIAWFNYTFIEGKQLAASRDVKFIETSSGIQHNVDELLVGILKQVSTSLFKYPRACYSRTFST